MLYWTNSVDLLLQISGYENKFLEVKFAELKEMYSFEAFVLYSQTALQQILPIDTLTSSLTVPVSLLNTRRYCFDTFCHFDVQIVILSQFEFS